MIAVKANRVYDITQADIEAFRKEGYDILGDNGEVIAYGAGKSVQYDKYASLLKDHEKLMEETAELVSENEKLKAEIASLKTKRTASRRKKEEEEE